MIYIFYRDTSHNKPNSLRPSWFSHEKCFKNLLDTLDDRVKLTVMFDGDIKNNYVEKYINYVNYGIQQISAGGDFKSNILTFEYIKSLNNIKNDDLFYILENDYLHIKGWVDCVLDLYSFTDKMHYTTLFDHNDKYICGQDIEGEFGMYKNLYSKIFCTNTRHWRTVPNTCASFIMSKKLFDEDYDIHINGQADNSRFDILSRERKRIVLSSLPGLNTHVQNPWMSPCIPWNNISNNILTI